MEVWRKLRRYGTLALPSSGYVLPNSPVNQERMEWLATAIRASKGRASVVQVQEFDDMPADALKKQFLEARSHDYGVLLPELKKMLALPPARRSRTARARLRRRFQEIRDVDFLASPLQSRVETLLARLEAPDSTRTPAAKVAGAEFRNRIWVTRPRPGIDRVSSAWLIRRFIDSDAQFTFAPNADEHPDAVPFDMFCTNGFGHRGDDCTFEMLCKQFSIRDKTVRRIAQIVHDTDLHDEKFNRIAGDVLDQILKGWAQLDWDDHELLERGINLIEGLYQTTP